MDKPTYSYPVQEHIEQMLKRWAVQTISTTNAIGRQQGTLPDDICAMQGSGLSDLIQRMWAEADAEGRPRGDKVQMAFNKKVLDWVVRYHRSESAI